jgi:hypothetical protein
VVAIPGGRVRVDLCLRELPRERLDLPLLVRQGEVHGRSLCGGQELPADLVQDVLAVAEGVDDLRVELLAPLGDDLLRQARQLLASR